MSKKKKLKRPSGAKESPARGERTRPGKPVSEESSGRKHWSNYLMIAIVIMMAFGSLLFFFRCVYYIVIPYAINYSEDSLLISALELAAGRDPYSLGLFSNPPYILTPYPPIYYLLVAAFVKIVGTSLIPGRIISILSSLGIAFLIFRIVRREKRDTVAGIAAGLTYLALYPVNIWGIPHRVDNLTILFAAAGLYFGTGAKESRWRLAAALAFFILSIFTKQSSIAAFLVVSACIWREDRKRAVLFAGAFAAAWVIIFTILYLISAGGYYFHTVTSLSTNPLLWERFQNLTMDEFESPKNIVIPGMVIFALIFRQIKVDRWALYAGLALAQALLTVGKFGSGVNYYLEFTLAQAILFGLFLAALHQNAQKGKDLGLIVATPLLLITVLVGHFEKNYLLKETWNFIATAHTTIRKINNNIEDVKNNSQPGDFLLTKRMDMALFAGRTPIVNDPFTFSFLAKIGKWDESKVVQMLRSGSIPLVILQDSPEDIDKSEFLTSAQKAEVKSHYYHYNDTRGIYFYKAKPPSGATPQPR